jgi:hypothetical protein
MHYFNVDGQTELTVLSAIEQIKDRLTLQGKKVAICTDVGVGSNALSCDRELWVTLTHPDKSNEEKIVALLEARSKFYKATLLPCLDECEIVLVKGGMIHDMRWMDYKVDSFQTVLKENLEMLQSLGGIAYPAGVILVEGKDETDPIEGYKEMFETRAQRMGDAMSRFKYVNYEFGNGDRSDIGMLLNP